MINTELRDLLREAYIAGRKNTIGHDEANFNDFIDKHKDKLELFDIFAIKL